MIKMTEDSKIYVKRFLDATKSNMLFANRLIFVEGISEQLLLPCFAAYLDKEDQLLNEHVCIVNVDSRTFKHFLKIFEYHPDEKTIAINKKVVCITDADPVKKEKEPEEATKDNGKNAIRSNLTKIQTILNINRCQHMQGTLKKGLIIMIILRFIPHRMAKAKPWSMN